MKVLHVETGRRLYGGALQVLYLVRGLAREGVENLLLCPAGSAVEEAAGSEPCRVLAGPMAGDLDVTFLVRLLRIIRRERPDILHLHSRRGADVLGGAAARATGTPCLLTRRVDNPERPAAARVKYRLCDRVVVISEAIREVLVGEGVSPDRITRIPSAVDPEVWDAPGDGEWFRREFGLPPDARPVGMAAQFIERKGHRVLIQAVPRILRESPEAVFLLFGRGPLEEEMRSLVAQRGLADRVVLAGFREDLSRILPCLDLLVHPALMEGLGVVLLQAQAAGVPVVASWAGGIPEAVADGVTGILVPPGDAEALAEAAARLLKDGDLARRMGGEGRRLVRERFSIEAMARGYMEVYREVTGERGRRRKKGRG